MNLEQENFDSLRSLLKLKRYEQPPPRYFNDFSGRVIARIQAGEQGGRESVLDGLFGESSWLQKLWGMIEAKPALPAACGAAICGLLIFGAVYTEQGENLPPELESHFTQSGLVPQPSETAFALSQNQPAADGMLASSTNPVIQLTGSLFEQIRPPVPNRAGFRFGN